MTQIPAPESFILKWRGDALEVSLVLDSPRAGRAAFRTNLGRAKIRRREIIEATERGIAPQARAWTDIPLDEVAPGRFAAAIPLNEVGIFSGKACFFPEGSQVPEWPEGRNLHVKVESTETRRNNSIYTVFPRQFGSFREIVRRLDHIMDRMGFKIIQTLPPFPVPTTYAVMGEYGSAFAATDFLSVDPAMAEFDRSATPLDQFHELIDAVHARRGLFFIDLPANHTGWASTLQTHHPEWFRRNGDGSFRSPGAWGVTWDDLVELDYRNHELRAYMAEVFLFWCRNGADGFRCDAGYMIPAETWTYIVARVREEYPDTIFMLEGLGGRLEVTDQLLAESNLDWAYSEIFQTYNRDQFEWYLPGAIARSERYGTLVHFAETHDNDRLARQGKTYSRLRVQLAALLSWQGAWGIANGVEWYCTEKIDVHGRNGLNWGAEDNQVELIGRLNRLIATHPAFANGNHLAVVTRGGGNTLAVARDGLLVLANLDCQAPTTIDWDRAAFSAQAVDLLTGDEVDATRALPLGPGEVRCLEALDRRRPATGEPELPAAECRVRWEYPRDVRREVVVPEGEWLEISSPVDFRSELVDPASGRTLRAYRSRACGGRQVVRFDAPHYRGDGTGCRRLRLVMSVFEPTGPKRVRAAILIPPPSALAAVRVRLSGDEVRSAPGDRVILANAIGAAGQVRLAWGRIDSQYDAWLAANPKRTVPSDRLNLWTRTRAWLQREGYVREFDEKCVTEFSADPAGRGARWHFQMPCGMGRVAEFEFGLALAENANAARLRVRRVPSATREVEDRVRIVFRPDLEWRSYHATTKAYQGAEAHFASCCQPAPDGVSFAPYGEVFTLRSEAADYHHEPSWTYSVGHGEEAARGQDGSGDLFSPGWFSTELAVGETMTLVGTLGTSEPPSEWPSPPVPEKSTLAVADALRSALGLYLVRRDGLKTVIAGYPWFLDWGRDTFIFMRGMIAAGMYDDSLAILAAFAAFEESGTLPNIIYGNTAGNRDTTDAQLWFIRCVEELASHLAGDSRIKALLPTCESIVDNYLKGTPNGIRVDAESALVWSPTHFTWMDTNYPACTPRVGYPVEIQALWISALRFLGRRELAERARASVVRLFKSPTGVGYVDCLDAPQGEPAARAHPDAAVRPNQLLLLTLGILDDRSILRATEGLLIPGGIRSLDAADPRYRGIYAGDEDTCRKPAYHNGTVWAWPFPLYAEALVRTGEASAETARQLLASAVENLNHGCRMHLSENADGDAPHALKGCAAQAWSDSELLRVWLNFDGVSYSNELRTPLT